MPEWDLVSETVEGRRLLLGETRWSFRPFSGDALGRQTSAVASKPAPSLPRRYRGHEVVRALFVPEVTAGVGKQRSGVLIVTGFDILK
jgi:hypothetical protein